jgi:hypothetical protein
MTRQSRSIDTQTHGGKTAPAPVTVGELTSAAGARRAPSKLDALVTLLQRPGGASLAEMVAATGWQVHSVRGALAGALRKRGHQISSQKIDTERRYSIGTPAGGAEA